MIVIGEERIRVTQSRRCNEAGFRPSRIFRVLGAFVTFASNFKYDFPLSESLRFQSYEIIRAVYSDDYSSVSIWRYLFRELSS